MRASFVLIPPVGIDLTSIYTGGRRYRRQGCSLVCGGRFRNSVQTSVLVQNASRLEGPRMLPVEEGQAAGAGAL